MTRHETTFKVVTGLAGLLNVEKLKTAIREMNDTELKLVFQSLQGMEHITRGVLNMPVIEADGNHKGYELLDDVNRDFLSAMEAIFSEAYERLKGSSYTENRESLMNVVFGYWSEYWSNEDIDELNEILPSQLSHVKTA